MTYEPARHSGRSKLYRPTIGCRESRAISMLGAYWMKLTHEEAERAADENARIAQKAMDEAPDISHCSRRAQVELEQWAARKELQWKSAGRINSAGMLKVGSRKPDRSTRLLYHLFKPTRGTRRTVGITRSGARTLRNFLYGGAQGETQDD